MDLDKINIKLASDIQEEKKLIIKYFSLVKVALSIILFSLSSFSFGTESEYEEAKHLTKKHKGALKEGMRERRHGTC